jgi:hypothetical protein
MKACARIRSWYLQMEWMEPSNQHAFQHLSVVNTCRKTLTWIADLDCIRSKWNLSGSRAVAPGCHQSSNDSCGIVAVE